MEERRVTEWKEEVYSVLESKRNEFELLGYNEITTEGIWQCLIENVLEKKKPLRIYEVVQAIFQLRIHTYMDFLALNSIQKTSDHELMASIQAVMQQEEQIKK